MWKRFINPDGLDYDNIMEYYERLETKFDKRENVNIPMRWDRDEYFSDERLLRRLIADNPVPKFEMKRGYEQNALLEVTLDRMDWMVNIDKLNNHEYENAHGIRPYDEKEYQPLIDYINNNY